MSGPRETLFPQILLVKQSQQTCEVSSPLPKELFPYRWQRGGQVPSVSQVPSCSSCLPQYLKPTQIKAPPPCPSYPFLLESCYLGYELSLSPLLCPLVLIHSCFLLVPPPLPSPLCSCKSSSAAVDGLFSFITSLKLTKCWSELSREVQLGSGNREVKVSGFSLQGNRGRVPSDQLVDGHLQEENTPAQVESLQRDRVQRPGTGACLLS